jgi:hypothetical protein
MNEASAKQAYAARHPLSDAESSLAVYDGQLLIGWIVDLAPKLRAVDAYRADETFLDTYPTRGEAIRGLNAARAVH